MSTIRAIGLVVYTYCVLEDRLEAIWNWFQEIEAWSGHTFSEYGFSPHGKVSRRVWKATHENRMKLHDRLREEQPWYVLSFGWPAGTLNSRAHITGGVDAWLKSQRQPWKGGAAYRSPSYIAVIAHSDLFGRADSADGFLQLAASAWRLVDGVYGFVDVETGVPPQADLIDNFDCLVSDLIPPRYLGEFQAWQDLMPHVDRRVWKAFWGNLLGAEHLRRLGGIEELRRTDAPLRRRLPEFEEQSYQEGLRILRNCACYDRWLDLDNHGVLLAQSESPLSWYSHKGQQCRRDLDEALAKISLRADG